MKKLKLGVLSTAKIGRTKVIPPMMSCSRVEVVAIASRDAALAAATAKELGIPRSFGSYEALLADPSIDLVYNPMPNHLHVPWTVKAVEAGKHVLCEKPIGITAEDARTLIAARDRTGKRIQEAFMVRTHPQWLEARRLIRDGAIGELRAITGHFSYFLTDPTNVRNQADIGGGGMLDIGCYPITTSRFVTGTEPARVAALIDRDPVMKVDRLGSVILDFPGVQASFVYSTQLNPRQTMQFFGTTGRLEVEIPFNQPPEQPARLFLYDAAAMGTNVTRTIEIPACDQYGIMADAFAASIQEGTPQPVPLEDSLLNMRVIDAAFAAAATGAWVKP